MAEIMKTMRTNYLLRLLQFIILFCGVSVYMCFYYGSLKHRESEWQVTEQYCKLDICSKECSVSVEVKPQSTVIKIGSTLHIVENGTYILHIVALTIGTCQVSSSFTCINNADFDDRLVDYLSSLPLSTPIVVVIKPQSVPWQDLPKDLNEVMTYNLGLNRRQNPHIKPARINATKTLAFTTYYPMRDSPAFKASSFQSLLWETSFREGLLISPNFTDVPLSTALESNSNINDSDPNRLHWSPPNCTPKWTIAVVIPLRKREKHLRILISNLFPFLQRQLVAFSIFVIDQSADPIFNKGRIMNIGFLEARRRRNYDCYIFHDVDVVPENLCNLYMCGPHARYLTLVDWKHRYWMQSNSIFGSAIILNEKHIRATNGFTNSMWDWGNENDNMFSRVLFSNISIVRHPPHWGHYQAIQHNSASEALNIRTAKAVRDNAQYYREFDGISTLNKNTDFRILGVERSRTFTRIGVSLPYPTGVNVKELWQTKMKEMREMYERKYGDVPGLHNKTSV